MMAGKFFRVRTIGLKVSVTSSRTFPMPAWPPCSLTPLCGIIPSWFSSTVLKIYQTRVFHIMTVESIAALVVQDLPFRCNHGELANLHNIIHDVKFFLCFQQMKYVYDAPVIVPNSSKPRECHLRSGDTFLWITLMNDNFNMYWTDLFDLYSLPFSIY